MNNMQIKNNDLAIYLGFKLNKIGNEFTTSELSTLKELNMNQLDGFGEYQDIDLEVLDYTNNLESLVLKNFEITDDILDKLKKMNNLKSISFESCIIDDFNKIGELDIDYLSITENAHLRTDFLKDKKYRGLILDDSDLIDISNIHNMPDLELLHVSNSHVVNQDLLENLTNLSIIHVENSDINDISFLESLPKLITVGLDKEIYDNNLSTVTYLENNGVKILDQGLIPMNEEQNVK